MLHDGKVVEEGSHLQLMMKNKVYANLTRIQQGTDEPEENSIQDPEAEVNKLNAGKQKHFI